jgi:hypothetical protein
LGEAFERLFLFEALDKETDHYEKHLRDTGDEKMLLEFLSMSKKERMAFLYSIISKDKSRLQRTIRRQAGPEEVAIDYSLDVQRRKVREKREQALYVDIQKDGRPVPSPFDITFDEAGIWLERAEFAVHLAEESARKQTKPPEIE